MSQSKTNLFQMINCLYIICLLSSYTCLSNSKIFEGKNKLEPKSNLIDISNSFPESDVYQEKFISNLIQINVKEKPISQNNIFNLKHSYRNQALISNTIFLQQNITNQNTSFQNSSSNNSQTTNSSISSLSDNNQTTNITTSLDKILFQYNIFYGIFQNNKKYVVESIIICFSALIILRILAFYFRPKSRFFVAAYENMVTTTYPYFLFVCILLVIFSIAFTTPTFTWGGVVVSSLVFFLTWIIFIILFISFSYLVVKKWEILEENSTSFSKFFILEAIKQDYNYINTEQRRSVLENQEHSDEYYERIEHLIFKIFFIVPFFTSFKPMTLRKDFNFSRYLEYCHLENMNSFQNITLFTWIIMMFSILVWNVWISQSYSVTKIILMSTLPLLGLIFLVITFIYLKYVYRKLVPEVNSSNVNKLLDLDYYNQELAIGTFGATPMYLKKFDENKAESKYSFTEHLIGRNSNYMEEAIIFGISGRYIIHNCLQSTMGVFVIYSTIIIVSEGSQFYNKFGAWIIPYFTVLLIIYMITYTYLISINLKYFTIFSSSEMNRKDKIIKKVINDQLAESAEKAESLFINFKKLYFDIALNISAQNKVKGIQSFNTLNRPILSQLVEAQLYRFITTKKDWKNKINNTEALYVDINDDLKTFLESCGNKLSNEEIEFLIHLVGNFDEENNKVLTLIQFQDIWGSIIHFSKKQPREILNFVFEKYFEEKLVDVYSPSMVINTNKISDFFKWYKDYFSQENVEFAIKECIYISNNTKEFTLDNFISSITLARRYHPI